MWFLALPGARAASGGFRLPGAQAGATIPRGARLGRVVVDLVENIVDVNGAVFNF
jgi:hypothetical protein